MMRKSMSSHQSTSKTRSTQRFGDETVSTKSEDQSICQDDLLKPQFYPDSSLFRSSLQNLTRDDIDLIKDLASHKTTIQVLAPYLKTMRKNIIQSATKTTRSEVTSNAAVIFERKDLHFIGVTEKDTEEKVETIVSIHETADVLKSLVKCNTIVSYVVDPVRSEICQCPRHVESSTSQLTWKIEEGTTMAAYAAFTKEFVCSYNVTLDRRFPLGLGFPESVMKYALCVPIKTPGEKDEVVAVYEMARDAFDIPFDKRDIQIVLAVTAWMGAAIDQNNLYVKLSRQQELTDYLVQLTGHYHAGKASFNKTLTDLVVFARETIGAEVCNIYTVSVKTEKSVTVEEHNQGQDNFKLLHKRRTKRLVTNDGSMLSKVILKLESVMHSKFSDVVNTEMSSSTRSIICVPILSNNEAIGAIQLKNKKTAAEFDEEDTETLQVFAAFCAICMNHLEVENKLNRTQLHSKVIQEMLFHHLKPCVHDEEEIKHYTDEVPDQFLTFSWSPSSEDMPRLAELTVNLFREVLGDSFMALNNVPLFVLAVKKCHRQNHYHNFLHAFTVTHAMANIILGYRGMFTGLERRALMVAALCHDVDHRGYTSHFIQLTQHYLSQLYDTSPLENHHFAITKMLIYRCEMFNHFRQEVYNELLVEIYENMLATDPAVYFQSNAEFTRLADQKTFTMDNPYHRRLVKNLMMAACDISGQTKPIATSQKTTSDAQEECYHQGDAGKRLGFTPLPATDRSKKDMIHENQVQFLSVVGVPCLETLSRVFGSMRSMVWDAKLHIKHCKDLLEVKERNLWKPEESVNPSGTSTV